jgi:succinate-semialdehyde dehydrogenase / glutarate-semialdehyde dehydrogenase
MKIQSVNPATGDLAFSYDTLPDDLLKESLEVSGRTFEWWSRSSFQERSSLLLKVADILDAKKSFFARIMAEEMGKLMSAGIAEVEKCAMVCRYYAEEAPRMLKDEPASTNARKSYVSYRPMGAILAVMPWNFPFWQVFRFAAPALMAGNTVVLKHASNVPACAVEIEKVFRDAGAMGGLFQTLLIPSSKVAQCIAHPAIKSVSFTGSTQAGSEIAALAGRYLKKCVLELGGSDPYIILQDADIASAVQTCVQARLINAGQSCVAAKRFIIDAQVYEQFKARFVEEMSKIVLGFPMAERTQLGPLASVTLRDELHRQVLKSIEMGAILETGGHLSPSPGAFYPATVLSEVQPGMPAFDQELFGPVAALIKAKDEADAIMLANDSDFGLGAAIFSRDTEYAEKVGRELIDAGMVFINDFVRSDPRLPFGGIKQSGYGRELSHFGIREFCNIKTVYVA